MKKLIAPIALFLLLSASCKKEEPNNNVTIPTYKTYSSIDEIFNELSLKPKLVSVDAGKGGSFYGNSGTRYIFQPNSFQDGSGGTVTGYVQMEVTEWLTKGDMIFSGMLPMSNGAPLQSGGEIQVKVTSAGKEVFLKPGMSFEAKIPQFGSNDTVMSIFRGRETGQSSNRVNWNFSRLDSAKNLNLVYKGDTISLLCDSFQLWNCDHFMRNTNLQSFKVKLALTSVSIPANTGFYSYFMFDGLRGAMQLDDMAADRTYAISNIPDLPVHIVSFTLINGHFYAGVQAATPKTGESYTVTLTEVEPKDFKAQLALYK